MVRCKLLHDKASCSRSCLWLAQPCHERADKQIVPSVVGRHVFIEKMDPQPTKCVIKSLLQQHSQSLPTTHQLRKKQQQPHNEDLFLQEL